MREDEWRQAQAKARRQSIWNKYGNLVPPQSYSKLSICNVQLMIAEKVIKSPTLSVQEKDEMLKLVDKAYNLGKRMAAKLDFYGATKEVGYDT